MGAGGKARAAVIGRQAGRGWGRSVTLREKLWPAEGSALGQPVGVTLSESGAPTWTPVCSLSLMWATKLWTV